MIRHVMSAALGGMIALLGAQGAALAQAQAAPAARNECFFVSQFENWKPGGDDKTIYIRVTGKRFYRLGMAGRCSALSDIDPVMVNKFRTSSICSPLDFDMKISRNGGGGFPVSCAVRTMTRLTPAEVAAIPAKQKP